MAANDKYLILMIRTTVTIDMTTIKTTIITTTTATNSATDFYYLTDGSCLRVSIILTPRKYLLRSRMIVSDRSSGQMSDLARIKCT